MEKAKNAKLRNLKISVIKIEVLVTKITCVTCENSKAQFHKTAIIAF